MTQKNAKVRSNPTDFTAVQKKMQGSVGKLLTLDRAEAIAAHHELTLRLYKYARVIQKRDAAEGLRSFLIRQTRSTAPISMDLFQLCVLLPLTHMFAPLSTSQRRNLALKLAFADHNSVEPAALDAFLAQLPPVRDMKLKLGKIVSLLEAPIDEGSHSTATAASSSTKRKRLERRKQTSHRLAGSRSHKLMKSGARAARRSPSRNSSDTGN